MDVKTEGDHTQPLLTRRRAAPQRLGRLKIGDHWNAIRIIALSQSKALTLRYLCRLFAKELVLTNFPGCSSDALMERMVEIMLYTEENLR